jgi:hypothetical protein
MSDMVISLIVYSLFNILCVAAVADIWRQTR